jgi:hypothetical protein
VTVNATPGTCSCFNVAHAAGVVAPVDCPMVPGCQTSRSRTVIVGIRTIFS